MGSTCDKCLCDWYHIQRLWARFFASYIVWCLTWAPGTIELFNRTSERTPNATIQVNDSWFWHRADIYAHLARTLRLRTGLAAALLCALSACTDSRQEIESIIFHSELLIISRQAIKKNSLSHSTIPGNFTFEHISLAPHPKGVCALMARLQNTFRCLRWKKSYRK